MKKKVTERSKYLEAALLDVKNGMDVKDFTDKWKNHKEFDSDDWLWLRNMIQPKQQLKK